VTLMAHGPMSLPAGLPLPVNDGAADHLAGSVVPSVPLQATDGSVVDLSGLPGRGVLFAYPRTGVPGEDPLVADWDEIPGARGCTPEVCSFRDLHSDIAATGSRVLGLSTQDPAYQAEAATRLRLAYPLLSDADLRLTTALRLPTFEAGGQVLLKRLTMVIDDGRISHVWYPVFPPDRHALDVLGWLRGC